MNTLAINCFGVIQENALMVFMAKYFMSLYCGLWGGGNLKTEPDAGQYFHVSLALGRG